MRIAFYAPLKPPDHPVPSGDRAMARSLIAALERGGHTVWLASRFRSYDRGDARRQARLHHLGSRLATRLASRMDAPRLPPDIWFTYHLYHKAPDLLGPAVASHLGIPYVVAEASFAPKQAGGLWDMGHRAVSEALARADRVFQLNPADMACVAPLLASPERLVLLPPFLDTAAFQPADRGEARSHLAARWDLPQDEPWLLTVAMMRHDQKLLSYQILAAALSELTDRPWRLILAGSGPAAPEVRRAFAPFGDRLRWAGVLDPETLPLAYSAADLYVWPAVKEAWGMALLEAQAAGLPVVAGRSGGVPTIVADGETGLLAAEGDAVSFAASLRALLDDPRRRQAMGAAALRRVAAVHDIGIAANRLDKELRALVSAVPH